MVTSGGHWHIDPETHHGVRAPGQVGPCCQGFATYQEVFGAADE